MNGEEHHPFVVLVTILARELDAAPPRFSRKRKRLRGAIRARLAALATEKPAPVGA